MTKPANYVPKLRRHKAKDLAYVVFSGRAIYLGHWGTPDARAKYDKLVAEWLDRGRVSPVKPGSTNTYRIDDLVADYYAHLEQRSTDARELERVSYALDKIATLYGSTPAAEFTLPLLRGFRDELRTCKLDDEEQTPRFCRNEINKRTAQIKRLFKWGGQFGKVPMSVYQEIRLIETVRKGEKGVRESVPVRPVSRADVDAILPHVSPQVRTMIELQWHSGMRPGEVVIMRKCDVTTEGGLWRYRPSEHKNLFRGFDRVVPIPTVVRGTLQPFLLRADDAFLFAPGEAEAERRKQQHARRETRVQPSQEARHRLAMRAPQQKFSPHYTTESYGRAIARACTQAGIPRWSPNRLRHAAATRIAEKCGLHAARAILGHSSVQTTAIYARSDLLSAETYLEQMA